MDINFSMEASLIKTADGNPPQPCSAYKDGNCEDTGDSCDACYENSQKLNAFLSGNSTSINN